MPAETLAPQGALQNKCLNRLLSIQEHGGTVEEKRQARFGLFEELDHHLQAALATDDLDEARSYDDAIRYVVEKLKIF